VVVDDAQDTAQDRVTIQEAAQRLGVKEDAISKRIQRGTLRHEKTPEGRVFVWVGAAQDATQDTAQDRYRDASQDALLTAKDETIAALREQLAQANERDRENRRIIAALTQRIPGHRSPVRGARIARDGRGGAGRGTQGPGPMPRSRRRAHRGPGGGGCLGLRGHAELST